MKYVAMIFAFALAILMNSCGQTDTADGADFRSVEPHGWAYGDTLSFVMTPDSSATAIGVTVRHEASYKYANLWLEIAVEGSDTTIVDTMNVRLSDKYGRHIGQGSGVSFLKTDTLPGLYTISDTTMIRVRHIMRVDTLEGIEQIGILTFPK